MRDIVERLQILTDTRAAAPATTREAGEEIKRLRNEIDRLRALVNAWIDAESVDGWHDEPECGCGAPLCSAADALRKAVGR